MPNMTKSAMLLFCAATALAAAGCGNSSAVSSAPATNNPENAGPTMTQPAQVAKDSDPANLLSVLSVEHQLDVASERDGVIVSVAKDQGSTVSKGDILAQLDDRTLQIEMVKAHDDLAVAQNNVKYKEAELRAKGAALQRQRKLSELGLSSQADLEAADFEAKAAEYDMHGWEAMAESSQADIHRLEIEIDQTHIRAPFSGAVVGRYVREGQQVAKGDKCFRVSQLAPLQVQFQVPESAAKRPRSGAPVDLVLVNEPGRPLSARVVKISPVVDPASDSYNVTAELTGKDLSDLRPGMAVKVVWPGMTQTAH
jgi:RND family efflux transporter MFP subunit